MRVFVTGGNGFIGSRVVHALVAHGHEVRCLVRGTSKTHRIDDVPHEKVMGDILDRESLEQGMKGCDRVIHLACLSSWDQIRSPRMREVVLDGTTNVLEAAKRAGGLRTVYVSSGTAVNGTIAPVVNDEQSSFDLDPSIFIYPVAKREAEALCRRYASEGLEVVIVNPGEVYGKDDDGMVTAGNVRDTLKDWPALCVTGGMGVCHVDDVAEGIVSAMDKGRSGERYILAGENITIRQFVEMILEAGGQKKPILSLPNGLALGAIKGMARLGLPTPVLPDVLDYGTRFWWFDCAKAERELGYKSRPAKACIGEVVQWLQQSGRA